MTEESAEGREQELKVKEHFVVQSIKCWMLMKFFYHVNYFVLSVYCGTCTCCTIVHVVLEIAKKCRRS